MKKLLYLLIPSSLLLVFIIWTILVKTVDVQYINDIGYLGFYNFNMKVYAGIESFKPALFNKVSDILMYLSFASILPFAIVGLVQLIKGKSFKAVNKVIYQILGAYVAMIFFYFVFEIVKINYAPYSTKDSLKSSYPSSHVYLFASLIGIALYGLINLVELKPIIKYLSCAATCLLIVIMALARSLSGRHWTTDIIAGLLLAATLVASLFALPKMFEKEEE